MKKLLGTTLALAMFVPAGANAELLKNFKVSGNLDIQTTSARNVTDFNTNPNSTAGGSGPGATAANNNDRIGHATTRVIVKMDWDLLDDVHSRVTLVKGAAGFSGTSGTAGTSRTYGSGSQDLNTVQSSIEVQEANVKIDKVMGLLDVTAGRQFYGEEGDLVAYYGPRDNYGMRVDALDMFRADWNGEHMSITALAGKQSDGVVTSTGNAATDLRGLVVTCKMHEMVKPTIYVYNQVTHATGGLGRPGSVVTGGRNSNLWVAGIKAKFAIAGLAASAEFAKNFGQDRSQADNTTYAGWAALVKAAYKLDLGSLGMLTPWGEFGIGSGERNSAFQAINTDYRPGGIYGRFDNTAAIALANNASGLASNGLTNRTIWGAGLKVAPAMISKLTVGAAYWRYALTRSSVLDRNIGSEIDVTADWKHSENVSFKVTAGTMKPGQAIANIKGPNAALSPAIMLAGDVAIKF